MEKRTLLRQVLRDLIDNRLEHFAPVSVYRSIELQPADPGVFPGFLDCGRVNAEFEYAHGLWWEQLRSYLPYDPPTPADYSWMRPNRRHIWAGLYLPRTVREGVRNCDRRRLLRFGQ
jgi:hypothetical protein